MGSSMRSQLFLPIFERNLKQELNEHQSRPDDGKKHLFNSYRQMRKR